MLLMLESLVSLHRNFTSLTTPLSRDFVGGKGRKKEGGEVHPVTFLLGA